MALQLGRMFSDGIRRVLTRTGGILFAGLLVIQLLVQVSINTAVVGFVPPEAAGELGETIGLTLPVSGTVATALFLATLVLSSVYFVGLSRALARPLPELSTFPADLFTRRLGRATLSMLVGGAIVTVSVTVGLMLFFLPGIFLAVCFLFFIFAVSVEDRGFVDALKRSWGLSRGNRLKLTVVVILSGVIGAVTGAVGSVLDLAGSPVVGDLVTNTISSVLFVLLYGIMAAAYLQLRDDDEDGFDGSVTSQPLGNTVADQ
ncbi:hypothetical protein C2R22_13620 [Salinigranum rubrum]|uniref:DUF7847 domain-containing protein n=1 Tax=Salinigranum rubrum TaxID=755307 RepID=A0A2I8VKT5_9EURY|nr:hypothetical protein [Salinigranum rubrum]AUV82547.1 hypothetical protein C2R22_13620 [Salinigranum rubrum]